jgi:hypothetical protein
MEQEDLLLEQLGRDVEANLKAAYFIGKYYFSISTGKDRQDYGLLPEQQVPLEVQRQMQRENLVPIFHEYIHYIHEISTPVGNIGLALDLIKKSFFSNFFDRRPDSCENLGMTGEMRDRYRQMNASKALLDGSKIVNAKILKIEVLGNQPGIFHIMSGNTLAARDIEIPLLTAEIYQSDHFEPVDLFFGKFFIYEGLAYELDRELDRQLSGLSAIRDDMRFTEYTVLRLVAFKIYPEVDTKTFLTIASLSLAYINCGFVFIDLLRVVKKRVDAGEQIGDILEQLKQQVRELMAAQSDDFEGAQDEIIAIFTGRPQLLTAFQYICGQAKATYAIRKAEPTFEVDLMFSGQYQTLLDKAPICDFMYQYSDLNSFNRDFLGTSSMDNATSQACKALISYSHYQECHREFSTAKLESKNLEMPCPFFSCCNLHLRQDHTDICGSRPWRIFEVSARTDHGYCWYGNGVLEFKGITEL